MSALITPVGTLSFPALFEARKVDPTDETEVPKFSASIIFDEEAQATPLYAAMKEAALAAAIAEFGPDAPELLQSGKLNWPFIAGPSASAPEGTTVIRIRSKNRPGVVSLIPDPTTGRPMAITDANELYAGAQVRASVGAFAYNMPINKGVSFGLNNVQKVGDGERLDGRVAASDEFAADASLEADLSSMDKDAGETATSAPAEATGPTLAALL